jgi:hypothetical protein
MMGAKPWTTAEDAKLLELELQGYSASLIGERMGRSRESIIGRSMRLRGGKRLTKARPRTITTTIRRDGQMLLKPKPPRPVLVSGGRLSIFELTETSCRWPFGDRAPYMFCGEPRIDVDCSYCEGHARIALSPRMRA